MIHRCPEHNVKMIPLNDMTLRCTQVNCDWKYSNSDVEPFVFEEDKKNEKKM